MQLQHRRPDQHEPPHPFREASSGAAIAPTVVAATRQCENNSALTSLLAVDPRERTSEQRLCEWGGWLLQARPQLCNPRSAGARTDDGTGVLMNAVGTGAKGLRQWEAGPLWAPRVRQTFRLGRHRPNEHMKHRAPCAGALDGPAGCCWQPGRLCPDRQAWSDER